MISYFFGVREGQRSRRRDGTWTAHPPRFWRDFHWTCSGVIVAAVVYLLLAKVLGGPSNALLHTEMVSVWAFGTSWLFKGAELGVLLGVRRPAEREQRQAG